MKKIINSRMQQKCDTSENWSKAKNFIPLSGEIIIYSDLNKIKIGDGIKYVNDLEFVSSDVALEFFKTISGNVIDFEDVEDTQVVLSKVYGRSNLEDLSSYATNVVIEVKSDAENLVNTTMLEQVPSVETENGSYIVSTPNLAKTFGFESGKGLYEGPFKENTPYTFSMSGSIIDNTSGFTDKSIWEQDSSGEYILSTKVREMYDNREIEWCFEEAYGDTLQGGHRGSFDADGSLYLNSAVNDWIAFRIRGQAFVPDSFTIDYLAKPNGAGSVEVYAFPASQLDNVSAENKRETINSKLTEENFITNELSFYSYYEIIDPIQHFNLYDFKEDSTTTHPISSIGKQEMIIVLKPIATGDTYAYMYPVGFSHANAYIEDNFSYKTVSTNTVITAQETEKRYKNNESLWCYLGGKYDKETLSSLTSPQILTSGVFRINSKVGEWHAFKFKFPALNTEGEVALGISNGNVNMSRSAEFYFFPVSDLVGSNNILNDIELAIQTNEPYYNNIDLKTLEYELSFYADIKEETEYILVFKPLLNRYSSTSTDSPAAIYFTASSSQLYIQASELQVFGVKNENHIGYCNFSLGKDTTGHTEYTYKSISSVKDKIAAAYDAGELNWKYLSSNDEKVETVEGYSSFQLGNGFQTLFNGNPESYIALEVNFTTPVKKLALDYIVGSGGGEFDFLIFPANEDFLNEDDGFINYNKSLYHQVFQAYSDFISSFRKTITVGLSNELSAGKYTVVFNSWAGNLLNLIGLSIVTENSTHYENYINFDLGRELSVDFSTTFQGRAFAYLPYHLDKRYELDLMNWRYETANSRLGQYIGGFDSGGSSTASKQIQYSGGRLRCYFQAGDWIAFEVKNPGIGAYRAGLNSESLESAIDIYGMNQAGLNLLITEGTSFFENFYYEYCFGSINAAGKTYCDRTIAVLDENEKFYIVLYTPKKNTAFLREFMFAGQVYDLNLGATTQEGPIAYFQYTDDTIDQLPITSYEHQIVAFITTKEKTLSKVFLGQKYGTIKQVVIDKLLLLEGNAPYNGMTLTFNGINDNGLQGIPVTEGGNFIDENGQMWLSDIMDCENGIYIQNVYMDNSDVVNSDDYNLPYIEDQYGWAVVALPEPVVIPFAANDIAQLNKIIEVNDNNTISVSDNHVLFIKYYNEENPLPRKLSPNDAGKFLGISKSGAIVPMEINTSSFATQSQITTINNRITSLTNKHNSDISNLSSLGMQCDLLWANASSDTTFVQQYIQLPETQYKLYAIEYSMNYGNRENQNTLYNIEIFIPNYQQEGIWGGTTLVNTMDLYYREVLLEEGYELLISSCMDIEFGSTYYNDQCIPLNIYGIK